ncbi:MAG: EamA family transporter [Lachnospiraceae bacterium]|jgi:EamA-like transporter family.|nr:EamA family transporter [Lachnospiraceae bacterium]MCX4378942.1 EamA family transporter [Lachnospiraceae bacterium]
MNKYIMLFLFSVLVSSVSQVILKKSTEKQYKNRIKEYFNMQVILAYGLFFLSSLLTIIAFREVPLSVGPILEASGYIYIAVLGKVFLHESLTRKKLAGIMCILMGIAISSTELL